MGQFEQPSQAFVSAGRHGWMIGVHIQDNPYSKQPFRSLWEKGWRQARRAWEQKRDAHRQARQAKKTVFNPGPRSRFVNKTK